MFQRAFLSTTGKIFCRRGESLSLDGLGSVKDFLNDPDLKLSAGLRKIAERGLAPAELFLPNGFKAIFSKALSEIVTEWFSKKLTVLCRTNGTQMEHRYLDLQMDAPYLDAAKALGVNANDMTFKTGEAGNDAVLCTVIQKESGRIILPAEQYESHGTLCFMNEFPLVARALETGAVLAADEFGATLHPIALMNLITILHNDTLNIHNAQLIFTTHNPIFLNANLFRRDEIRFVERTDKTHCSALCAMSDFDSAGEECAHRGSSLMWNYLEGQYGAICDIDFSLILEKLIAGGAGDE